MGSFGVGPFENDSALDWLATCTESMSSKTRLAFERVLNSKRTIESSIAATGVAAAALLAESTSTNACNELFISLGINFNTTKTLATSELVNLALEALDKIESQPCELYEEWEDSGRLGDWLASLHEIAKCLFDWIN